MSEKYAESREHIHWAGLRMASLILADAGLTTDYRVRDSLPPELSARVEEWYRYLVDDAKVRLQVFDDLAAMREAEANGQPDS